MSPPDVTVYSNAEKVRLYIDGTLIGEQFPDDVRVSHPPFTFRDVKRKYKGRNRSVLRAEALVNGETVAEKSVKAPGIATRLMLVADYEGISLKADGSDIVAVRCSLIDNDGTVVPLSCDNHPIKFTVAGEGSIVGDSSIGANPICAEAGISHNRGYHINPCRGGNCNSAYKINNKPRRDKNNRRNALEAEYVGGNKAGRA